MFWKRRSTFSSDMPFEILTMIGSRTEIRGGVVVSQQDLRIDGTVDADVVGHGRVVIGPEGCVRGAVVAQEAVVFGSLAGSLYVREKLVVQASASIHGSIEARVLSIMEGASGQFGVRVRTCDGESQRTSLETVYEARRSASFAGDGAAPQAPISIEMSVPASDQVRSGSDGDLETAPMMYDPTAGDGSAGGTERLRGPAQPEQPVKGSAERDPGTLTSADEQPEAVTSEDVVPAKPDRFW